MTPEELRVLTALERKQPDRVPLFELGANPLPILKVLAPFPLRYIVTRKRIYEDIIGCAMENYGMVPKKGSLNRALIRPYVKFFTELPKTYDRAAWLAKQTFRTPIKLGYDSWVLPIHPTFVLKDIVEKNGKVLLCDTQNTLYDIEPVSGDPRAVDVLLPPDEQLVYYTNFLKKIRKNPREILDYAEKVMSYKIGGKKIKEQVCVCGMLIGFFEAWYSVYGISNMHLFFRQLMKEHRDGNKGPYHDMLEEKLGAFIEITKGAADIGIQVLVLGEDCAMQTGPMVSPSVYKSYFFPFLKEFCDEAHKVGIKVILHTDGRLEVPNRENPWEFMEALLDTGIDGLHPIEEGVNDVKVIKKKFGRRVCLLGNIDTDMLQNGTPEQVTEVVKEKIKIVGSDGGYICGSDNGIFAGTDVKNWLAMVKAVKRYGVYEDIPAEF